MPALKQAVEDWGRLEAATWGPAAIRPSARLYLIADITIMSVRYEILSCRAEISANLLESLKGAHNITSIVGGFDRRYRVPMML